jgi:hypothetical protein
MTQINWLTRCLTSLNELLKSEYVSCESRNSGNLIADIGSVT